MQRSRTKITGMMPALLYLILPLLLASCSLPGSSSAPTKAGKAPASQQVYISPLVFLNGSADLTTLDPALAHGEHARRPFSNTLPPVLHSYRRGKMITRLGSEYMRFV